MGDKFQKGAIISYLAAVFFVGLGLHKMYVYEAPSSSRFSYDSGTNAYVGGDAYNYIINANYATAFFVLAILCVVVGLIFIVARYLDRNVNASEHHTNGSVDIAGQ